jgi:hypothetical protein
MDRRIGSRIDRYEVLELIGEGGMGVVYRARDTEGGHEVAVKLLHTDLTASPQLVERFYREARATVEISSPHIVRTSNFGRTDDNECFLVMELLGGQSLHDLIENEAPLSQDRACHIALQVADALRVVHEHGVVHRDLKPGNVQLVEHRGDPDFVKVLDFGLAKLAEVSGPKLTQTGMILGSPAYMAPEQASGSKADHRSDVYALGTILYELLAGDPPFAGLSTPQTLLCQINTAPVPLRQHRPEVAEILERLVHHCLDKYPGGRPQSMEEVHHALSQARALCRVGLAAAENRPSPAGQRSGLVSGPVGPSPAPDQADRRAAAAPAAKASSAAGTVAAVARTAPGGPRQRRRPNWYWLLVPLIMPAFLLAYAADDLFWSGAGNVTGSAPVQGNAVQGAANVGQGSDAAAALDALTQRDAAVDGDAAADALTDGDATVDGDVDGSAAADWQAQRGGSVSGSLAAQASLDGQRGAAAADAGHDEPLAASEMIWVEYDGPGEPDGAVGPGDAAQNLSQAVPRGAEEKERQVVLLSSPDEAHVFQGTKKLGTTPLTLSSDVPLQLVVKREGYQSVQLFVAPKTSGILSADLVLDESDDDESDDDDEGSSSSPASSSAAQSAKKAATKRRRKGQARRKAPRRRKAARRGQKRRRRRRKGRRIHSLSKLAQLHRRKRIKTSTYRKRRRSLIKERQRRLRNINRLRKRRKISRRQHKRYVRAIYRYYR